MATDRADVVCAPNGQTPINRCSAKLDFGGINPAKACLWVCGASALGCSGQCRNGRATVCTVSLIFLKKASFRRFQIRVDLRQ